MKDRSRGIILAIFFLLTVIAIGRYIKINLLPVTPRVDPGNSTLLNGGLRAVITDRDGEVLASGHGQKRKYRFGALFEPVLGYAIPGIGVAGIEARYGDRLTGTAGMFRVSYFDPEQKVLPLETTLSLPVQAAADKALGSRRGAISVFEVKSGEVWTQVSHPSCNPNTIKRDWIALKDSPDAPLFDRTSGRFPPGSVMKVADVLLLQKRQDVDFQCTGAIVVDGLEIRCSHAHGRVKGLGDAFIRSCNSFFIHQVMEEGDSERFYGLLQKLGFIVPKVVVNGGGRKKALAAIGQGGVLLSPMQGARIAAAIVNNGQMPELVYVRGKEKSDRVMEPEDAKALKQLMEGVVKSGTGRSLSDLARGGARLGLKTGTAQIDGKTGYVDWAIGFYVPSGREPAIAFAVVVEDAKGYASDVCLPIVRQIVNAYQVKAGKSGGPMPIAKKGVLGRSKL